MSEAHYKKTLRSMVSMDKTRLALIYLHVLITTGLVYDLHPHSSFVHNSSSSEKLISAMIVFVSNLLRLALYHSACILAVWFCERYGAATIRGTGILLIGELLDYLTVCTQHTIETHHVGPFEFIVDVVKVCIFLSAIVLTFQLAKKVSKDQMDSMQLELLTAAANDSSMSGSGRFDVV